MLAKDRRATLLIAALAVAGCNESSVKDFSAKANNRCREDSRVDEGPRALQRDAPIHGAHLQGRGKASLEAERPTAATT